MKKTFLSIAILASSILAYAGTNNSQNAQAPATEQTAPAKNTKDGKKAKGDRRAGKDAKADREKMLFSGITLTDAQKAKLDDLKAKNKAAREAKKKEGKERRDGLTAGQRERQRAEKAAERRAFLAEVKQILTPEQYATFLENNFVFNNKGHKGQKGHKADRKGHDRKSMASGNKASSDKRRS